MITRHLHIFALISLFGAIPLAATESNSNCKEPSATLPFKSGIVSTLAVELRQQLAVLPSHEEFLSAASNIKGWWDGVYDLLLKEAKDNLAKQKIARCALSDDELVSIWAYAGGYYYDLNSSLRAGGEQAKKLRSFARVLSSALAKIPQHHGTVFRSVSLPKEALIDHVAGQIVVYKAFTSASSVRNSGFSGSEELEIQSCSGRDISAYSPHPKEKEVLFPSGTRFLVTKIEKNKLVSKIYLKDTTCR